MPISLIPRKGDKKRIKFQPTRTFLIFAWTFLFLVLVFFGIEIYKTIQSNRLEIIKKEIVKIDIEKDIELERKIKSDVNKIDKIKPLLDSHIEAVNVFDFLEKNTYSEIKFSNFDFRAKEGAITMTGIAPSASVLILQLLILKQSKDLDNVELSGISITKEGINFQLNMKIRSELLKIIKEKK